MNEEHVSTVRSVVGMDYTDMDIIRALHLANNDVTAAINIIFDTPNFSTKDVPRMPSNPRVPSHNSQLDSRQSISKRDAQSADGYHVGSFARESFKVDCGEGRDSTEDDWWFVDCGEVAGLSTCKGRKVRTGDTLFFTFPLKKSSSSPSPGKFGKGRNMAACSEIVRFSTKEHGEVSSPVYYVNRI